MTEIDHGDPHSSPTIEVVVFEHGVEVHRELCESNEDAELVVERWSERDGVMCQVDDLSVHHRPGEILEPDPADLLADDGL